MHLYWPNERCNRKLTLWFHAVIRLTKTCLHDSVRCPSKQLRMFCMRLYWWIQNAIEPVHYTRNISKSLCRGSTLPYDELNTWYMLPYDICAFCTRLYWPIQRCIRAGRQVTILELSRTLTSCAMQIRRVKIIKLWDKMVRNRRHVNGMTKCLGCIQHSYCFSKWLWVVICSFRMETGQLGAWRSYAWLYAGHWVVTEWLWWIGGYICRMLKLDILLFYVVILWL
jgi:hypothetical protein